LAAFVLDGSRREAPALNNVNRDSGQNPRPKIFVKNYMSYKSTSVKAQLPPPNAVEFGDRQYEKASQPNRTRIANWRMESLRDLRA
jgi:hypothetical protein